MGFDTNGVQRYAAVRGIGTNYKGEAIGSNKRFSFSLPAKGNSEKLHIFESAIDLLSYATIMKMHSLDYTQNHMLSLAGVFSPKNNRLPLALSQYLSDHSDIKSIHLHLDNDPPGIAAANAIMENLNCNYEVVNSPPTKGKDVNEYLTIYHKTKSGISR